MGKPLIKLERFSVYVCDCGVKYLDPSLDEKSQIEIYQNSDSISEINKALEQYYEYEPLRSTSQTARDYDRALTEAGKSVAGRDLCEIGCGTGDFLFFAKSRGWNVFGIDSSTENIEKTRSRGIEGIAENVFRYSSQRRFDVVVLWDVIEHPQDPGKLLAKCHELLKPGGCLLVAIPYDPNLISILATLFYKLSFGKVRGPAAQWYVLEHTSYFSGRGLKGLLERNSFAAVKYWKTETDLARYKFAFLTRLALRVLFGIARILGLQNRSIMVAKKV